MVAAEYDFLLFDLDGTLVDTTPEYRADVLTRVGERMGCSFSEWEVEALWHGMGDTRERCLRECGLDEAEFWDAFHEVEDPEVRANHTFLYDDAASVGDLDVPVGIVTHCQEYLTGPVLDHLDIADWFDTVVCCTDDLGWKPDPTPVRTAMTNLGVAENGHEGALVGDDPVDIGAAWNAGLDGVHVERVDPEERGMCVWGDYRIRSVRTLADGFRDERLNGFSDGDGSELRDDRLAGISDDDLDRFEEERTPDRRSETDD